MKRLDTTVSSIRQVAEGYYELRFAWPAQGGDEPGPGRFVTIRAGGRYDPALRRPFAFSDYRAGAAGEGGEAAIVFQVRGRGTAHMAGLRPGDSLDALGPLGKGFGRPARGARPVLVAGGIGVGPMLYLAATLAEDAAAGLCEAPILAMGFRNAAFAPDIDLPAGAVICTDDGSSGFKGTVADWLAGFDPGSPPAFYACGPAPMMAAVARLAEARRAPYEAAVEQWMACGVGACAGCAVPVKSGGFVRACVDGPVLDGSIVDWEASR
ncbi:MAG: dihydroorotate dehydrogenase electron transfer subunit [Spirochaetae bacterium HGW-Spirochaetae-3]|jgi:dihydroorotate dehydrogenase electron transfer subunit|nr:MAG: dihydroorotate dehydrogenase electron transfer subunit [Spirochaetae bacterium HGW-Spirochaetae-3]